MGEQKNLTQDDVLDLMRNFEIQPLFNKVVITLNREEEDGGLVLSDNTLSEIQYVLARGSMVKEVEVGQKIIIDIEKMMVPVKRESLDAYETVMQVKIDPIKIGDNIYAIIEDRYIKAKDNR